MQFDKDSKIIKSFINKVRNYKKLIIDIRDNAGGDDSYWKNNIVSLLINKPSKETSYYVYRSGSFEEDKR